MPIVSDPIRPDQDARKLQEFVERSSETVFTTNSEGQISYVNPAARKLTGFSPEELKGKPLLELVVPDWRDRVREFHTLKARRSDRDTSMDYPIITRHGVIKWVEEISDGLTREGQFDGLQGVLRDVTERVRAEETRKQLKQLQAEFISTVSHELKTPLTSIMGYIQMLQYAPDIPERYHKQIEIIDRNAKRLRELVDDILHVEKLEMGQMEFKPERLDLSDLIEEVAETFRIDAEDKGLALDLSIPPGLFVEGDRSQLILAFSNLISNAIKYSQVGEIIVTAESSNGFALTKIQDTGSGIAEDEIEHIFERFYRSSAPEVQKISGTGLGLYITNEILKRHGGEISVISHLGEGTTFKISLRLHAPNDISGQTGNSEIK